MLTSLAWLNEFVDLSDLTPSYIADRLIMVGLEVEGLYDFKDYLDEVEAALLVETKPIGKLTGCLMELGDSSRLFVLCGATNLSKGKLYPLARIGVKLPGGIIKPMTVEGTVSEGMLASAKELLVGEDHTGILELGPEFQKGQKLSSVYEKGDHILEISVTPNRGDALCHLGVSRDLAAILGRPMKNRFFPLEEDGLLASEQMQVEIDCPGEAFRYCGRVINACKTGPSPLWMAARLLSLGSRPINNIVDVTNYVMLELGLPLHAFDLRFLEGGKIVVKLFGPGTKFTTLDGQERVLVAEENVLICDGERPVAIGGVMGGLNSEVKDDTTDVFLEGAMFNPVNIRRTSKTLGLSTDASFRFERGQDVNMCPVAVDRAASLISSLTYGKVAPGLIDTYPRPWKAKHVPFSPARCNALLGTNYQSEEMQRVLSDLGIKLKTSQASHTFDAEIPSWRLDITQEADLAEEVVRILDFENLPQTLPKPPKAAAWPPLDYRVREFIRDFMVGRGFMELMSYSFLNGNFAAHLELKEEDPRRGKIVNVVNPLSEEQGALRTTIVPSLLNAAKLNQYHNQWDLRLFEVGNVFFSAGENKAPLEKGSFGGLLAADSEAILWCEEKRKIDFYDLKGHLEALAGAFGEEWDFLRDSTIPPFLDMRQAAAIYRKSELLGHIGLLSDPAFKNFGLKRSGGPVYIFELDLDILSQKEPVFVPYGQFPAILRDIAVVVENSIPASKIIAAIKEGGDYPLKNIFVFDVYSGEPLPSGFKSLALRLSFQSSERTLTEELVSGYFKTILEILSTGFGAKLRT
ncbi:MAG: phenylalanine--tRNA ligase subunit beta [Deltaproteobacteria bacterium]|jgi:phenylalanyl-tRNA synthetase beta chain|nr:phenylalanine--tRNA ligase subunit beta [Deltaproteobacteria bacterium]